jgi:hypothetical protein
MSLAAFNAETASGEGAHGPDRSRLAKCYHCRTSRQGRQPAEIGVDPNTSLRSVTTVRSGGELGVHFVADEGAELGDGSHQRGGEDHDPAWMSQRAVNPPGRLARLHHSLSYQPHTCSSETAALKHST